MYDFTIIGAGVLDVLARPVNPSVFESGSLPVKDIAMSLGGDALNESTILSRLGKKVQFISVAGEDEAGTMIQNHCHRHGISTEHIAMSRDFSTSINLVLVDEQGERSFLTNPQTSLRRLDLPHIDGSLFSRAPILCLASIFVYPLLDTEKLVRIFSAARNSGCTVCADMTKCKNGETLETLRPALSLLDYVFPNYQEAAMVSQKEDPDQIADAFLDCGVRHFVMKLGAQGCLIRTAEERFLIPAWPHASCVDTTGAGDNFAAGFLYALSEGMDLPSCGRFANAAASIAIESVGACTGVQSLDQVMTRFREMDS